MAPQQTHKIKITQRLSTRIVLAASVYSFLIALVVSGLQIYVAYQQAITDAKQQFQQIESGYIANIVSGLWVVDNSRIEALVGGISHLPHVAHVELTDETHHSIIRETSNLQNIIAEHQYPLIYREGDFIYDLGNLSVKLTDYQILHDLIDKSISIAITTFIT